MTSYVTPKKNAAFVTYVSLEDQANAGLFKASPTLAAGDFKVSIDGGALANLATLPTNTPSGSAMVKISLSADEMNGDNITVVCKDAAGAEWYDLVLNIQTSARQIDDLAYPATSGRSLTVAATGEASANVTYWAGVAVAGAPALEATAQAVLEDTGTTLPALFAASGATVTVISTVSGGTITVYVADTWSFTVTDSTLDLSGYEVVALSVKRNARQADAEALLYLRSDTGLQRIGGAAPASAGNGTLSKTSTSFTALVALAETAGLTAGQYTWWLKGFDTTPAPDTGFTLATGEFVLERAGLAAVA